MNNENTKTSTTGPEYWMSLEQYAGDKDFAARAEAEFASSPLKSEDGQDGFARREFLKLMGASLALAGSACIRRPVQKIIPYAQAPKEITPGVPNFYASTWYDGVEGYGALIKTLEGRPIKMEGNPLHPMNLGGLTARAHAEVLSLYDPDRLTAPVRNLPNKDRSNKETISAKWDDVDKDVVSKLAGGGVVILSSTLPSPSTHAVIGDFAKVYGAKWVQYDTMMADSVREANRRSYGKASVPRYRFDNAKMVVSIDADFLGTYLSPAEFMKQWSKRRVPGKDMGRMVAFESTMTLTGLNSDDRYRIKPSQQLDIALGLLNAVVKASGGSAKVPANLHADLAKFATVGGVSAADLTKIGHELWENRGAGLVIAGGLSSQTEDAVDLQMAVNLLNSALGNDGVTIDHDSSPLQTRQGSAHDLAGLIEDMAAGKVKTLIIHNLNPGYALPKDAGFAKAIAKVPFVIYTGNRNDETGRYANYVLPHGTTLESWGDYELESGVYSIQQPTIRPLHDSRAFEDSLLVWAKAGKGASAAVTKAKDYYEYVMNRWQSEVYPKAGHGKSFDEFWLDVLQQGVVVLGNREAKGSSRSVAGGFDLKARVPKSGYELALYSTQQMSDGRYANVSWIQELPDLVTKIVWDNHLSVSFATARKEGFKDGDMVEVHVKTPSGDKSFHAPIHIQPGLHDEVMAMSVGYGRPDPGKVGKDVGINAYEVADFNKGDSVYSGLAITKIKKTGEKYRLVATQQQHILTEDIKDRQIVAETSNSAYMKNPGSGIERTKIFSIWPKHQYSKHKWGMAIDLNACTGCSACVMACQSENNIPTVGKRYVMDGREMHWIRIDRYYKGSPEAPDAAIMPLLCQQCENAPCETVCPVLATVHNDEGLNDMVYNRCVGTRYCSNNCPYKVRRFNWFNYSKREAPLHMALNPDVTVRVRGVMEKCTFCVHRIRHATKLGKEMRDGSKMVDGTIKTACQQTCPTDAITFGDLNDKESRVSKMLEDQRTYGLLEDLNTVPRVRYMSKVRNTDRVVVNEEDEKSSGKAEHEMKTPKENSEKPSHGPESKHKHELHQGEHV